MNEVPETLQRLDLLLEAMFIAHEAIYDLHRRLVSADRASPVSRSLLAESAQAVLQKASEASAPARALAGRWHEQAVLDPQAAKRTALEFERELARVEPVLRELLVRESAIAAELRALAAAEER